VTLAPALHVQGLVAGYPGRPVLHGVDLEVPPGALLAVLGGSGSGKTTLLRTIAGFHPADAGTVHLAGTPVAGEGVDVPPERRRVGLVPQDGALFGHLTVAGNVAFGLSRAERRGHRVAEMLELVGLSGYERRMPAELSGGQQQRVALARALAPRPALVLLDEPFTALDAGLRADVREQVRAALRAAGATAVLVTHDQQEALGCADLVAVLRDGRVAQCGPPRLLYDEPADVRVGTFLGEAVVLPATVRGGRAVTVLGAFPADVPDGPGHVLLRPEQLCIGPLANGRGPGADPMVPAPVISKAVVTEVVFHGHDTTVILTLEGPGDGTVVRCRTAERHGPAVGERVGVTVRGDARFYPA
jgi:iron(III) transport system ATP-binding protein